MAKNTLAMIARAHRKGINLDPKLSEKGNKLAVRTEELAKMVNTVQVVVSEAKLVVQQEEVTVARRVNLLTRIWAPSSRLRDVAHEANPLEVALLAQHLQLTQADIRLPDHRGFTTGEKRQIITQLTLDNRSSLQPVHKIIKRVKKRGNPNPRSP